MDAPPTALRRAWHGIRDRILGGLLLVLPILITLWVLHWLYATLERHVIDPVALLLWRLQGGPPDADLPVWFARYVAPLTALLVVLVLLYGLGFFVHSRLRRGLDWVLLRLPVISILYDGLRKVFRALERPAGGPRPQRVVLIPFPHPGMRVPAFVTATCRDAATQKAVLCVYVPTTPVPTSGYFLLVPADEVTELDWTPDQALQAIISAGLTAPPEVRFYPDPAPAAAIPDGRP